MDFFGAQDRARRNTRRLLLLFAAAVASLVLLANLAIALALQLAGVQVFGTWEQVVRAPGLEGAATVARPATLFDPALFLSVGLVVCAAVLAASLLKHLQLARGGRVVAEMLGGRLLDPASAEPAERRLLNVVEEMAIAAGLPVPPVYVLPESGINAFAAGHAPTDAVVGVTDGAMRRLGRDALQGVVAHEFSHVLNGDMRLDMRLIAALHGIVFLAQAGRVLLRAQPGRSGRRGGSLPVLLVGLALLVIGSLGVLFARAIKAGVSREREFLADASAVQFTRNPDGLASALRAIGALTAQGLVRDPHAETASHLFFAQAVPVRLGAWFATHPPLAERIRRLDPGWDGRYPALPAEPVPVAPEAPSGALLPVAPLADVAGLAAAVPAPAAHDAGSAIDPALRLACRDPARAATVVLGVLSDPAAPLAPAVELAMPALKRLDADARQALLDSAAALAARDGELALREIALLAVLENHLGPDAGRAAQAAARFRRLDDVAAPLSLVLCALSQSGQRPGAGERFAAAAAGLGVPSLRPVDAQGADWPAVRTALRKLRGVYPLLKPRVLKAFRTSIGEDAPAGAATLQALAAALDCPAPGA